MTSDLQKASMWKRISAFLFDGIVLSVVAVLFALMFSAVMGYDGYMKQVDDAYAKYSEIYGVELPVTQSGLDAMTEEQKAQTMAAYEALNGDGQAVHAQKMMQQQSVLIPSLGFLMAFLLMEFLIPLLLKNGQTLGKKCFSIAVMHTNGVKIGGPMLFARTILGKYAVETMVPLYIILMILMGMMGMTGLIVLGLMLILQIGLMIGTYTNAPIHDLLAKTVVVDMGSQRIFDSPEALLAYKKKQHEEQVTKSVY